MRSIFWNNVFLYILWHLTAYWAFVVCTIKIEFSLIVSESPPMSCLPPPTSGINKMFPLQNIVLYEILRNAVNDWFQRHELCFNIAQYDVWFCMCLQTMILGEVRMVPIRWSSLLSMLSSYYNIVILYAIKVKGEYTLTPWYTAGVMSKKCWNSHIQHTKVVCQ